MGKKLNTNSNVYIIIYAIVMVVVVAFLLAFVSKALQSKSDANVAIDKKSQILTALNIEGLDKDQVEAEYAKVVEADQIVDSQGNVVDEGKNKVDGAFKMGSKDISNDKLPLYICKVGGDTKYVIPVYGMGLWGALWGYVAVNSDGKTVYGAYFSHESETAGLGALITEKPFQDQFDKKVVYDEQGNTDLSVVKVGKTEEGVEKESQCDAITGATLTSNGVDEMLEKSLKPYYKVLNPQSADATK